MTTVTVKAIKVGDSLGVTIPARDRKRIGIKPGDELRVSFELVNPKESDVTAEYAAFKAQYGQTLKNLADR